MQILSIILTAYHSWHCVRGSKKMAKYEISPILIYIFILFENSRNTKWTSFSVESRKKCYIWFVILMRMSGIEDNIRRYNVDIEMNTACLSSFGISWWLAYAIRGSDEYLMLETVSYNATLNCSYATCI